MVANSPGLIAGSYVLHRLLVPRHPPIALSSLSHNNNYKDARVHYTVLKIRAGTPATTTTCIGRTLNPGKTHPVQENLTNGLVKTGPSHTPTPATRSARNMTASVESDPEKPIQEPLEIQGPIPQDPTARLDDPLDSTCVPRSHPQVDVRSTSTLGSACSSNGQCSTFRSTIA